MAKTPARSTRKPASNRREEAKAKAENLKLIQTSPSRKSPKWRGGATDATFGRGGKHHG